MLLLRRRVFLVLITAASLCLLFWQSARTQSPLRRITTTTEDGKSFSPTISGDGRIIAFESTEDIALAGGPEGFRAIRANVSVDPPTFLQMGAARGPAPAISQDGSRIAFSANQNPLGTNNDANSEIFLFDGAKLNQITNTSPGDVSLRGTNGNFLPSISDDGRYIAFSSNRNLTSQNSDGNLEIFVYDSVAASFVQATNSTGMVGFTDAKISGDGNSLFYIRDTGQTPSTNRDLVRQNRQTLFVAGLLATNAPKLSLTYGRAVSDDGLRVVWSAETSPDASQLFLWDGRNSLTRQVTALAERVTEVPLHPSISGDGSRISFAARRTVMPGNSDNSIELYTFEVSSGTLSRVTTAPISADGFDGSRREVEVVSSLSDDGAVIAFNFPRVLSGLVANSDFANNPEIYVTGTTPRPAFGQLTILNGASFGNEPATTEAVAPDSVAVARGSSLAFRSEQSQPTNGAFPTTVAGTTVTVNGRRAQGFFASPTQVNFHVPAATELGTAEVVVTNSDGFSSRGTISVLTGAPGVFTKSGDGLGEGVILEANTLTPGPFDPSSGNLRLIIFATGARRAANVSVTAGGRTLTLESVAQNPEMPGLDEIHVLVPADLRGVGKVDLVVTTDGRQSNPVIVEFSGVARRDVLINEFLADPGFIDTDPTVGDANRDGVRSASQDEFVELVNTTVNDIDISGYRIFTRGTGSDVQRHLFPAGTVLPSCSAIVVFGGGNPNFNPIDPAFGGAQVVKASSGGLSLGNVEGVITLQDQAEAIVNLVAYGGSSGIGADNNQSVTRAPDITGNFAQHLAASGGARPYSPGTQINGAPFSSCAPAVTRVEVLPASATIGAGGQQQFTAKAFDASNNEVAGVIFTWQSSNTAVATVDQNGLANGISAGTSEIRATGRGVQSPPAILTVNPVAPPNVLINEVDSDQTGTDTAEFIEIYDGGAGNTSLTRLVVVLFNGSDDQSYAAFDLDGFTTNASGYFTLGGAAVPGVDLVFADGLMQNGPDAVAIYVGNATDFPNGTPVTTTNLIDALVYDTNDADVPGLLVLLNAGQPQVNEDAGGNAIANSNQRCPNGSGGPRNTSTYNQFAPTPDAANVCLVSAPALSIDDVAANEGNAGSTVFTFTVSLSSPAPAGGVTFDIATADNTATIADNDYVAKSLTAQTIAAGAQTYQFTVTVNGDVTVEPNESFLVNVTNVNGATPADGQGVGTIQNDDLPALAINDVSQNEGDSGTSIFTFTVSLSTAAPTGGVTFDIATQDNNATVAGNDYAQRSLTSQTIAAGNTTYTFDVTVNGDTSVEINESFFVNVTNVAGASVSDGQGQGTIQNDDSANLSINDVSANETNSGTTIFTFTITSSLPAPAGGITFDIATADGTAQDDNPGTEDNDYVARALAGQTIPATQTTYTFDVTVTGDTVIEPNETFFVNISNASGATISDGSGTGTILNDDTPDLVISQVYAGGGNTGAQFTNDFVEIFNQGTTTVNFATTAFSVQYAGAAASFGSSKVDLSSGSIAPAQYFLVQLSGGANGSPLPTPDATGSIAMAATAGKVALVLGTTALSGSGCPLAASVVDFVGYGTTSNCFEGTGPAPAPSNTTADFRKNGGCTDTNDNAADFLVSGPFPRNSSSSLNNCAPGAAPNLMIANLTFAEGNSGTTTATFIVTLSAPANATDITFDIATADGTAQDDVPATEDNDYVARALTGQVIPAGQTSYTFTVNVNSDAVIENDETFLVNVTNVSGAMISDGQAVGTIQNDDLPALSTNDVFQNEGNAGTSTFAFTVSLSAPAPTGGVTFDIATADGTAQDDNPVTEDNDYVAQALTSLTIPAGSTTFTFNVTVNGDVNIEPGETFFVNVTNVTGATVTDGQGQGTIQNDDSPSLSIADVSANETNSGTTTFTFTVTSSLPAPAGGITFDIATADGTAQDDNPISEDNDYVAKSLTSQTIPATQTTYTFDVTVNGDTFVETDETFVVNISNATGANVSDGSATGTIVNDDIAKLVISQIYGAGGNVGATYQNDFIEIFNRGTTTVNLTGWSVQYVSATGTGTWSVTNLSGTLVPGQYYLIQEAGGANGGALPTPDATGAIAMAATAGKVALVSNTVALTGGCPSSAGIIDLVGYGTTATCFEGAGPAPAPGTTTADFRKVGGCTDTNNNAADFLTATPAPRNAASALNDCNAPPNLTIDNVSVTEGNSGTVTANFTVSLSSPAPAGGVTFDIATQNDTATTADNDYVLNALTSQTIAAGNSTYNFAVTVNGDINVESNETFFVNVTNVIGANVTDGQGVGTIQNDDSAALPALSVTDVSLAEGNSGTTTFAFTVNLSSAAPAGGVTFDIATADNTAQDDNPATEDNDYVAQSLTSQTIAAGNTSYTFNVTVNGDTAVEPTEAFLVNVTNVTNATITDGQGVGTIQNDDSAATPGAIVISQVYGGGGNAGAPLLNDFIELFNRGGTAVDVSGWSVQYSGATATTAFNVTPICPTGPCLIQPGQYFLVKEASGGANGAAFAADVTGTIAMSATAGRVALVNNTTALVGSTACGTLLLSSVDFVGYGSTANCFEGAGPTAAPGNSTAVLRATNGCTDTNVNSADFATGAPNPRNTSSSLNLCPAGPLPQPEQTGRLQRENGLAFHLLRLSPAAAPM